MLDHSQQAGLGDRIHEPAGQPVPGHGVARPALVEAPDLFPPPAKFEPGHGRFGAFGNHISEFAAQRAKADAARPVALIGEQQGVIKVRTGRRGLFDAVIRYGRISHAIPAAWPLFQAGS